MRAHPPFIALALVGVLVLGFVTSSTVSYFVAHESIRHRITHETLPLTSDNIYSEIQRDLLRSILIASLMAHDTFVRDWITDGERDPEAIIRYLGTIQEEYGASTAFFVSEATRRYYHPSGVLREVEEGEPTDAWYFRVRQMAPRYEINLDNDTADPGRVSVFVNYRVHDEAGRYLGAIGIGLGVDRVAELINTYEQRYGRTIWFMDRSGRIRLHGRHFEGPTRIRERAGLRRIASTLLTQKNSSTRYKAPAGHTVFVDSRLVEKLGWYLVIEQRESRAETRVLWTLLINIAIALCIAVLVFFTGWCTVQNTKLRLEKMATTDALTGCTSRQGFDLLRDKLIAANQRRETPVALMLVDIDGFKRVNDRHGHAIGDTVLRTVAEILRAHVRDSDVVCRWGGDEFVLLLGECRAPEAARRGETIRDALAEHPEIRRLTDEPVTLSIGISEHRPPEPFEAMLARADQALYATKHGGRDGVRAA